MTSSEPSRRYSAGLRRLGFDERTTVFYDEHVEADAVHEQIAAGRHVRLPGRRAPRRSAVDVLFGAAAALAMDGVAARHLLGAWEAGRSALRGSPAAGRLTRLPAARSALWWPSASEDHHCADLAATQSRWASRRIRAAGRGRHGALGAEKPDRLWVPSQNGLMPDLPHRQSATVSRPGSISTPSWSTSRKSPRTISGPSRYGVIVAPGRSVVVLRRVRFGGVRHGSTVPRTPGRRPATAVCRTRSGGSGATAPPRPGGLGRVCAPAGPGAPGSPSGSCAPVSSTAAAAAPSAHPRRGDRPDDDGRPARPRPAARAGTARRARAASPPANSAGPSDRAGFTDVPVSGMPIRWTAVSAQADGQPGEARRRRLAGHQQDHRDER